MRNTPLMVIGIILVVFGVVALVWHEIGYTKHETVVDVGSVSVTTETRKAVPLPPILGGLALAAGAVLIVVGARKGEGVRG